MAQYRYDGLDPEEAPDGSGLARPLDVRDFDAEPDWGAWTPLDGPEPAAPVPVAAQLAAGVAPADTVTLADQRAGADAPAAPTGTEG